MNRGRAATLSDTEVSDKRTNSECYTPQTR
jgi:hypothetical protein